MTHCPVGENCTGCQYAERLRADVKQPSRRRRKLTRERDAARFDAARMTQEVARLERERDEALRHLEVHRGLELELCETRGALSEARRAALEEAAGIAERAPVTDKHLQWNARGATAELKADIAAAIRAAAKEERR